MDSWTHPAGSTVTPVTCAAKEAGRVEATSRPASSLAGQRPSRPPGGCGTVSNTRPGGRVADDPEHAPVGAQRRPLTAGRAHLEPRRLLGHDDVHAVGPRHVAQSRVRTHGSCSIRSRRRAGVDVEQRRLAGQTRLAITCAVVSWMLPLTVTARAPKSGECKGTTRR